METGFLVLLAIIYLVIASFQDIKKREVPNWLSFSLIIFALAFRVFYSLLFEDLRFFVYGLLGFFLFFILAYAFYYGRIFAGGDAKLLMALGAVLPFGSSLPENLFLLAIFVFLLLFCGSIYGFVYSLVLISFNRKNFFEEFKKQFKLNKILFAVCLIFAVILMVFSIAFGEGLILYLPLLLVAFPLLFVYSRAVEESCMIKEVEGKEVTIGDWLYEEVKIKGKKIKPYWEGLNEKEVAFLRKYKGRIKIKYGIPFVPAFLFAFIILIILKNYFLSLLSFFY